MDSRYNQVLEGAAYWGSYYRENPEKFAADYLHLRLRLFQKILLSMMFWSRTYVYIAARGQGKTFLSAVYCVIRCILYPGTKICIASGTRGQAINVLSKITHDLMPNSLELRNEIDEKKTTINGTNAIIVFHNTSTIEVVTSSDSARGKRANVVLLDEFRLIKKDSIDTILKKFLTQKREPPYLQLSAAEKKEELSKEHNLTVYLSSAYYKDHWSYTKCVDTFKAMLNPNQRQFICGFPYQLSIEEGLLDPQMVEDEMVESDFSEVKFAMEMSALFFGADDGSFFEYDTISKNRHIKYPMLPDKISSKLPNQKETKIKPKQNGEIRILSADIALMSSNKHNNDATAIFVNQMLPTKAGRYMSNIVFADAQEGLHTDDQALIIRKYFDEYQCDWLVLDCQGIGLGIFDALARDITDPDTGEIYPALSCCNNAEMAARCTVPNASKVIWAIKASAQFNSDCAFNLREGFRSGRVRLLSNEYDAEDDLKQLKGYNALSLNDRMKFQLPYIHTTLLIDELVKLQHEESNGKVRVYERSGMRKDRYSSLSYNYYVANQLEQKVSKRQNINTQIQNMFIIKPPVNTGKAVSAHGRGNQPSWYQQ